MPYLERTKAGLVERLNLRIDGEQIDHPDGRVVVFHVPPRPLGFQIQYKGAYWRAGESLVPMTPDLLKRIFNEGQPDFSAEVIPAANIADLDPAAIMDLHRQSPRNRRLAEALARCGLVVRSGQGFDRIFTQCIRETKPLPDFSCTDNFHVHLTLHGTVQDLAFLRFLEKIRAETQRSFTVEDFLVLDLIKRGQAIPPRLMERLPRLRDAGVVESVGRGRGIKYILSKRLYSMKGERGAYTRVRGLDREHKKALILQHLENYGRGKMEEFQQLLPSLDRHQILKLLGQLRTEGKVRFVGPRKTSHWELLQPKYFF